MSTDADARGRVVYVGNLPLDASSRDVDRRFAAHGVVARVEVKRPRHPPAFAFVTFDDARDAARAARGGGRDAVIAGTTRARRSWRGDDGTARGSGRGRATGSGTGRARGDWDRGDRDDGDGRDRYAGRMRSDREGPYDRPRWRDGADARSTVRERAGDAKDGAFGEGWRICREARIGET